MAWEAANCESTARSPNSFLSSASYKTRQFALNMASTSVLTRYVLGSWGSRFRIKVVFPLPRNPTTTVTGVGVIMTDSIEGKVEVIGFLM